MPSKVSQKWALALKNDLNKTLDAAASLWDDSFVRRIGRAPGTELRKYLLAEWTASSGFGHPFAVGGSDEIADCGNELRLASFRCNKGEMQRSTTMPIKLTYIAPLLAAGAAAVAIPAAPTTAAVIGQTCSGNICQSPGNVQINNAPAPVHYHPYGDMPFLLGGQGGLLGGLF